MLKQYLGAPAGAKPGKALESRFLPLSLYPMRSHHMQEIEAHFPLRSEQGSRRLAEALQGVKPTFICFTNRVGSNYLTDLVDQAGLGVRVSEEDFNSSSVIAASSKYDLDAFDAYLARLVTETKRNGTIFFKIGASQLFWLAARGFISDFFGAAKFIFLRREDKVAQAISLYLMKQTGMHLATDKAQKSLQSVAFDRDAIAAEVLWITENEAIFDYFFNLHSVAPLVIWYEDLVKRPVSFLLSIANFIGLQDRSWFEVLGPVRRTARVTRQKTGLNDEFGEKFRECLALWQTGKMAVT